jgi:hypothetical protein
MLKPGRELPGELEGACVTCDSRRMSLQFALVEGFGWCRHQFNIRKVATLDDEEVELQLYQPDLSSSHSNGFRPAAQAGK